MRWQGRRGSSNIEDRRRAGGRMGGGFQIGGLGLIVVLLLGLFFGVDLTPLLNGGGGMGGIGADGGGQVQTGQTADLSEAEQQAGQFVAVTLADTEEIWGEIFAAAGESYTPATLVLFSGVTPSPCGNASGATGPFYCPLDQKVYLDTAFFATLSRQLGAGGDFAAAYVVAHEVAHHVQDELGILSQANAQRERSSQEQSNAISVMIELQADCLSGVWARAAESRIGALDAGDIDEALNAAARIGDDILMRSAGRVPMPESFTHGSSEQRQRWFSQGYTSGSVSACDTFSGGAL